MTVSDAALIQRWFEAALGAAEPASAVQRALRCDGEALTVGGQRIPLGGRLIVVGVGKAAVPMACGAEVVCGDQIETGLVITKDGHATGDLPRCIRVVEAAHPIPDERGVRATHEMLDLLEGMGDGDVVLALISGGGSALLEAPRPPVTLADVAETTNLMLRAGAPIQDLNRVRIPLSLVKGGGLRRAAGKSTMVTLILSDVLGNDTRIIASGPTVRGEASGTDALALLDRYRVRDRVPLAVIQALETNEGVARLWDFPNDVVEIVADNETALKAVRERSIGDGYRAEIVWTRVGGEASELGRAWVGSCLESDTGMDVLLGGGEATVTVHGDGVGGRNTEFALAAALELEQRKVSDWTIASVATDGQDGPTNVAGAIADSGTCDRARIAGVQPERTLADNDSLRVFDVAGGLVTPGPTGTNVNDLYFAVRRRGI
ncbi:MAG: glycerate 2-kinase [Thermomicrobiales bacterium]|nr:glycerate 2-kinase [Thermomicrobiales bacterium]